MTATLENLQIQIDPRRNDDGPIYQRIADALREAVLSGEIAPGQKLPAMSTLAKTLGVSPLTVGRGYELLEAGGIVTQIQGSGTFVQPNALRRVKASETRQVRTLFMVLGFDCLTKVSREVLFITTDLIGGINDVLDPRQTHLVYVPTLTDAMQEMSHEDAVIGRSPSNMDFKLAYDMLRQGKRLVSIWEPAPLAGPVPCVTKDYHQTAVLPCQHLVDCGFRRIGYIGRKKHHHLLPVSPKFAAFVTVLNNAGLDISAQYVREVETMPGSSYRAAKDIIDRGDIPEAIFVDTDYKAMEVIAALNDAGLSVPGDVSIASYDDVPDAATFSPPLTTVRSPRREIGQRAAQMLLNWPTDGTLPASLVLDSTMVVRQSTRNCPTGAGATIS